MTNINATKARKNFYYLINDILNKHEIIQIHHSQGDVVLLSKEEFESLQETLELLSIPGFRESLAKSVKQMEKGETYTMEEVFGKQAVLPGNGN
ncbi:MAG: type II toxin-antitoxin system Phd/YefM family antitoxin [Candidatus Schekmanbacteria bacterium]|nr:type II toxin-antitoxin system Phd/YefM family antitoxin [Candidatus Schekmanbacteria bacterium]